MKFTEEQVEALARVLFKADGLYDDLTWESVQEAVRETYRDLARAVLSSDVFGDLIADVWDEGSSVGWADCAASDEASRRNQPQPDETPNPYRAAALSPTPAEQPCERDDGPDPGHEHEGYSCVTHNRPWPCRSAGEVMRDHASQRDGGSIGGHGSQRDGTTSERSEHAGHEVAWVQARTGKWVAICEPCSRVANDYVERLDIPSRDTEPTS